ncbi:phosphoribosylaminoimidazolesuccinocarboxamide synthase [Telmatocola sphagniphila]|uniref:Phosphoribosylaminoimidazole-succinocarboxamide synthase n=1 Tax=Telmatocola sphagniphila TaxID=1123043 RepID=A0A8E6B6N8_9BACT|nr:phosphoribosylaminoimidazolesuccinocarboxamide synthase [Telmatocola sphagniphila]QVL33090.1 phosphoribosylaminoimidazolesuccinocarboxamide synthase [Telmatocola sphagniphila]
MTALMQSDISGFSCRRGKVRDVYDLGDKLLIVATDRISAFDWVMPTPIPGKGRLLSSLTKFWLNWLKVPNHFLSDNLNSYPPEFHEYADQLNGRAMLVRKTEVIPFECVVRGYLAGSGWKEYKQSLSVCGVKLPSGLRESDRLPEAIFTPATKAETGHDENVSSEYMAHAIGKETTDELARRSIEIYNRAASYARLRGIIIADTKFEWGLLPSGEIILIDEVLTPDSSRFWPMDHYQPGRGQPSFDKQYLRDWLESTGWDKQSPPPVLPEKVVAETLAKYTEAYERLSR